MFTGSMTALVTPFRNGMFDQARYEEQIAFQISHGTQAIVPVGTTGESPTLSHEEHRRAIEIAVHCAQGTGVKVIAGTGSNATDEAISLTRFAKGVGADGALIVNPYYNKPNAEGLYQHFKAICSQVDIPVVLYNIPGRTGITMTVATALRLANDFKNIVAIKEATGSLDMASEMVRETGLTVLSGDDSLTLPIIAVGGSGVISVASNIIPGDIRQLTDAARAGNLPVAQAIHQRLFGMFKALFLENNPGGVKCGLEMLGRDTGELRLPLVPVSAGNRLAMRNVLLQLGLLNENLA